MKYFIILCMCIAAISAQCIKEYDQICSSIKRDNSQDKSLNCNAVYGNIEKVENKLKHFTKSQINQSYFNLFLSSRFGNYEYNRKGFQKLYSEMSDKAWENTIKLVKHMSKRGIHMKEFALNVEQVGYSELQALAVSADHQIKLASEANGIILHNPHDPEITQFIEESFLNQYADKIRELVGYNTDLMRLVKDQNTKSLAMEIFDMHLQKL